MKNEPDIIEVAQIIAENQRLRENLTRAQEECTKLLLQTRELEHENQRLKAIMRRLLSENRELESIIPGAETQQSISEWANNTLGTASSTIRIATRANEEMAELLGCLSIDDAHPKALEEIADVFIVLYRAAWELGGDVHTEIDRKMAINRAREWRLDGSGHGYHVKAAQ